MNKSEEKHNRIPKNTERNDTLIKSRISKLAIISLVLGISSLFLFILTGIPAIVIGIISHIKIRHSNGRLKGKYISLAAMNIPIPLMCLFYLAWNIDAPPITNDYKIADFRSAPAEYTDSYELVKQLIDPNYNLVEQFPDSNTLEIGLSQDDIYMIGDINVTIESGSDEEISEILSFHKKSIVQVWNKIEKARDIIEQLDKYPEIADLVDPTDISKLMFAKNYIDLARIYQAYACLQNEEDKIHFIAMELVTLDSVFRKLSLNIRPFITKLCCIKNMEINIATANALANNPSTSQQTIELLRAHFVPITKEQMSLRNGIIFEYLFTKTNLITALNKEQIVKTLLFKKNSCLRWSRNLYDCHLITNDNSENNTLFEFSVWPDIYPFKEPSSYDNSKKLPLLYRCYNPFGSIYIRMISIPFERTSKTLTAIPIKNDFLTIILNKRLGIKINLKALAYSDEYIIDIENKKIFSPGPDGKSYTNDDIILPINPEVLNLTE